MISEERYKRNLKGLLEDKSICEKNRELFRKFFEYEEYKLKRTNNLRTLDAGTLKTLYGFISKFKNINSWFHNKPLEDITQEDIKRVYDALEDGKIVNSMGSPFKDRQSYYNKIFKSKLFQMVGKADLSREVMEFCRPNLDTEVRFIKEETVRELIDVMISISHKLLAWMAFDIGENVNSLLRLRKKDCFRQINELTKSPEYLINLDKSILKRSRTPRTEPTNYQETVKLLDLNLKHLKDDDLVFSFKYSMAKKTLTRAIRITGAKCIPKNQHVTWKDLRSSMACDLLSKRWNTDEVNARLGHRPSSREIDRYVTFLAIDKQQPKKKIYDNSLSKLQTQLEESQENEKLQARRIEIIKEKLDERENDQREFKKKIEIWKNNTRKELMAEALEIMKREVIQK